jgi:hypothetical protein
MVMSRDENEGRIHSIKTENNSFEKMEELKNMEKILTDQNYIQEEIKSRWK